MLWSTIPQEGQGGGSNLRLQQLIERQGQGQETRPAHAGVMSGFCPVCLKHHPTPKLGHRKETLHLQ